jgi:hypothetical protein
MKSALIYLSLVSIIFSACTKEANRKALKGYFNYEVSGKKISIGDEILLQDNTFECTIMGDSVIYIHATKVYHGAGFIVRLKEGIGKDGMYSLDSYNKGFYENADDIRIYYTNDNFKGTLNLKNGTFQGKTLINTLQGTFEFEGVDVTTGKSFKVTNGSFLMERKRK